MDLSKFENTKRSSLSHQTIKLGRLLNERGLQKARSLFSLPNLKQSHLDLFAFIDFDGTSITEIAKRKEVSKQAVSKLVLEMEEMGIIHMEPNPMDSRGKLIFFKTSGKMSISNGFKALLDLDQELKKIMGNKNYSKTAETLSDLIDSLSQE